MITFALIGLGKWGKNYLSTVQNIPNCQIKYVKTRDYQDLLIKDDIDGVIIATPSSTHFEIACQFLEKGFNMIVEKPLTTSIKQAEKLLTVWQEEKSVVLVGFTYLYHPAFQHLKNNLSKLGEVQSISFEGLNSPIRHDVSVLWDWGPHAVSLFLDLVKSPVAKISARGQRDQASLELEFKNGVKAKAKMKWVHQEKVRKLVVVGSNKTVEVNFSQTTSELPLLREIKEFINAIKNNTPITSDLKFAVEVTKVLSEAERSLTSLLAPGFSA